MQDPAQHAAAAQAITAFRDSPHALQASVHALQHSASPDACFQAALALRVAALRSWQRLSPEERGQLRAFVLHRVKQLASGDSGNGPLLNALCALHAILLKLAWLDLDDGARKQIFAVRAPCAAERCVCSATCACHAPMCCATKVDNHYIHDNMLPFDLAPVTMP